MLKYHHIGIACKDVEKTKEWIRQTHTIENESDPIYDPLQKATLSLIQVQNNMLIELISGEKVLKLIKSGVSFYHICYSVKDFDKSSEILKKNGCLLVSSPHEAILFNKRKVAFFYTPLGLIEILGE